MEQLTLPENVSFGNFGLSRNYNVETPYVITLELEGAVAYVMSDKKELGEALVSRYNAHNALVEVLNRVQDIADNLRKYGEVDNEIADELESVLKAERKAQEQEEISQ